jgi:hypothetical protein
LLYQEHFLSAEVEAAATGTQDTKQNSPKIIPDGAGCVVEGASTSKTEAVQVTNVSDSQAQGSATGESRQSLRLVTYSVVHH